MTQPKDYMAYLQAKLKLTNAIIGLGKLFNAPPTIVSYIMNEVEKRPMEELIEAYVKLKEALK